jgi:predicted polyphosphate/ATP-dependent NAD kinase
VGAGLCTIGIIANPASARDIRRVIANASNLQISDRVNIVLRTLTSVASIGVTNVLMMPDKSGLRAMLVRHLERENNLHHVFPQVEFLDMATTSTVDDTFIATRMMCAAGVKAIVVPGGDGTHRAVVRELIPWDSSIPIAGLSTGTNNAFPEMRESTITGIAVGLYATGQLAAEQALAPNKMLEISINDGQRHDIALVDAVISTDRYVGARALWRTESLHSVFLTFAEPQAIGLSAIGGLLQPVGRRAPGGLAVRISDDAATQRLVLRAPIAPGMVRDIGIANWELMPVNQPFAVTLAAGVVALDGERELAFDTSDKITVTLRENAFLTVDVARCMQTAAATSLFHFPPCS